MTVGHPSKPCLKHADCHAKEPHTGHQAHLSEALSTKSPAELLRAIPVLKSGDLRAHCCPGEPKKDGMRCDRPQTLKQKKDEDRKRKQSVGPDRQLSQVCPTDLRQTLGEKLS